MDKNGLLIRMMLTLHKKTGRESFSIEEITNALKHTAQELGHADPEDRASWELIAQPTFREKLQDYLEGLHSDGFVLRADSGFYSAKTTYNDIRYGPLSVPALITDAALRGIVK